MQSLSLLIVAATLYAQVQPGDRWEKRESFKRRMMPSVGKVITVVGSLEDDGKVGEFVKTDDGGHVHLKATKREDSPRLDELYRLMRGKRVAVTGTLRFAEEKIFKNPDGSIRTNISAIAEHLYVDIADATIRAAGYER